MAGQSGCDRRSARVPVLRRWGEPVRLPIQPRLHAVPDRARRRGIGPLEWLARAAAIVAVPVFLYYGGGANQYGFRYSLDFTPFLIALVAAGSARWNGWPERLRSSQCPCSCTTAVGRTSTASDTASTSRRS